MKFQYYLILFVLFFSCGQKNKKNPLNEGKSLEETMTKIAQKKVQDSLNRTFCDCLLADSLSQDLRLQKIDKLLSQKLDINRPCQYPRLVTYKTAGNIVQNIGASMSNFFLKTHITKKSSQKILKPDYPPLLVVSNDSSMVYALIQRGANPNLKTKDFISLGQSWTSENDIEKLQRLIDLGMDMTELQIGKVNEKTLDFLIDEGAKVKNIDKIALFEIENYKKVIEKYKIDVKNCSCKEFEDIVQTKPYLNLSYQKAKYLLEQGVSSECIDVSVLEKVVMKNFSRQETKSRVQSREDLQKKWFKLLAKYDVNWNQCGTFSRSPLISEVMRGQVNTVQLLIDNGAKADFKCIYTGSRSTDALLEAKSRVEAFKKSNSKYALKGAEKIVEILESSLKQR